APARRAGAPPAGGAEAPEVVVPAAGMALGGIGTRQAVVAELQQRPVAARLELDLDRARPRRDRVLLAILRLPAEGVDEAMRRIELDELAGGDVPVDHVHTVLPTGPRIEPGLVAEPAVQLVRLDEELPHGLRAGVDCELALDRSL